MTEKQLVEYSLEDSITFLVEVEESDTVAVDRVALPSGRMVAQAKETFEQALDHVKPVAVAVVAKLKDLGPNETEIKFGIRLTADAGAIFTSIGGEVNFEITVKWSKEGAD